MHYKRNLGQIKKTQLFVTEYPCGGEFREGMQLENNDNISDANRGNQNAVFWFWPPHNRVNSHWICLSSQQSSLYRHHSNPCETAMENISDTMEKML